jgi:hypothetical protein
MNVPWKSYTRAAHQQAIDMALLPGTPMLPNKPAIAIWYRNPLVKDGGVLLREYQSDPYLLYTRARTNLRVLQ